MDPTVIGFGTPSAESEAKTQAGSIGASLLERPEQCVAGSFGKAAALVFDLDQHAIAAGAGAQRDFSRFWTPCVRPTSARERPTSARSPMRLR